MSVGEVEVDNKEEEREKAMKTFLHFSIYKNNIVLSTVLLKKKSRVSLAS